MGKGSNVQKKQQAQIRNAKDRGKTDEERKAAADKTKYVVVVEHAHSIYCGAMIAIVVGGTQFISFFISLESSEKMPLLSCANCVDRHSW